MSRRVKADLASRGNRHLSAREVFSKVYSDNMWGGEPGVFSSGPGSSEAAARPYADFVVTFKKQVD
jgi:SAM-dependent methyltransferase